MQFTSPEVQRVNPQVIAERYANSEAPVYLKKVRKKRIINELLDC